MPGPIELAEGDVLKLKYGFYILDDNPADGQIEKLYEELVCK